MSVNFLPNNKKCDTGSGSKHCGQRAELEALIFLRKSLSVMCLMQSWVMMLVVCWGRCEVYTTPYNKSPV